MCPFARICPTHMTFYGILHFIFVLWVVAVAVSLMLGRGLFEAKIRGLNWLIKTQGLEGQVSGSDKAYQRFRRDLWIILGLLFMALFLLRLI